MKQKFSLSISKKTWLLMFVSLCLIVGGILILTVSHIYPVMLMQLKAVVFDARDSKKPPHPAFSIEDRSPEIIQYFMPIFTYDEIEESHQKLEVKPDWNLDSIDFSPGSEPINVVLIPNSAKIDQKRKTEIRMLPDLECAFGEGKACVYSFLTSTGSNVLFTSVHSGVGGEADAFRDLIEGTGINQGLFNVYDVDIRMEALRGAEMTVRQGDQIVTDLELVGLVRIPPEELPTYMSFPVEKLLDFAVQSAGLDPALLEQDLLVLETCGWHLPGEDPHGLENTSSSIYLALAAKSQD